MKFTDYGYRIKSINEDSGKVWLFLPGGPGLGSEYLEDFVNRLNVPGSKYLLDFPMDGTNEAGKLDIKHWQDGLLDVLKSYDMPILVTHSFSGMFAQFMPEIQKFITGLVLMNTTDGLTFFNHLEDSQKKCNLPDLMDNIHRYHADPSKDEYKRYVEVYKHYCYTTDEMPLGEEMIKLFAYNNVAYNFGISDFYSVFESKWVPESIPTLTIAGELDYICPPHVFDQNERYMKPNIINHVIQNAGHCSWVKHFDEVQKCFDEFVKLYENNI